MKKFLELVGYWWIITLTMVLIVIFGYASYILAMPIIFLLCSTIIILLVGYILSRKEKERLISYNLKTNEIIELINCLHESTVNKVEGTCVSINSVKQSIDELRAYVNRQAAETYALINGVEHSIGELQLYADKQAKEMQILIDGNRITIENAKNSTAKLLDELKQQIELLATTTQKDIKDFSNKFKEDMSNVQGALAEKTSEVKEKIDQVNQLRKEDKEEYKERMIVLDNNLHNIAHSFANSVEAYQELEMRMVMLEKQNIHLQMLTVLIATVRSDVAAINSVRGFVEEANSGRKIRIVRDDENKIVVENLMDDNGIRIEKSKMYSDDQLVFETEFDTMGRMTVSKSYSNGELNTEITYTGSTPILKDVKNNQVVGE